MIDNNFKRYNGGWYYEWILNIIEMHSIDQEETNPQQVHGPTRDMNHLVLKLDENDDNNVKNGTMTRNVKVTVDSSKV